jgi:hypothetical protein
MKQGHSGSTIKKSRGVVEKRTTYAEFVTLRHTHAVACLRAGMSERELQVRLGHATIETTLLYRRLVPVVTPISPLDASPVPLSSPVRPPEPGFCSVIRAGLRILRSFVSGHMPVAVSHPIPSGP